MRIRRGLGAAADQSCKVVGTDPANGSPIVHCDSTDINVTVPVDGGDSYFNTWGQRIYPGGGSPGIVFNWNDWLNNNAGKIAVGAGVLFGVVLITKAMR
jgi:hypothetical protein